MKTGIHFERCNTQSATLHNERNPEYLASVERSGKKRYDIFHDRTQLNSHWTHPDYAEKSLDALLDEMRQRYRESVGQAPQEKDRVRIIKGREKIIAGWSPIREGVCPVREDTTLKDFFPFQNWLKERGVQIISIDIHLDEGHVDPKGERVYNRHAHLICDWTNHLTGKTVKLDDKAMSEAQGILADALDMERGKSRTVTGVDHLTALEYREKKAGETLAQLNSDIRQAQCVKLEAEQAAEMAIARQEEAETTANKEALKSNLYDIGSRIAAVFGRGAVAESRGEAEDANLRAVEAERRAAEAEVARLSAENAQKQAEDARLSALSAELRAKEEKSEYGKEMFEKGRIAGREEWERSASSSLHQFQEQLGKKQEEINKLKAGHDDRLKQVRQELGSRIAKLEEFKTDAQAAYPKLENLAENKAEMLEAGLSHEESVRVIRGEVIETEVKITHNMIRYKMPATVKIGRSKGGDMRVWFNHLRLKVFIDKAVEELRKTLSKGMRR